MVNYLFISQSESTTDSPSIPDARVVYALPAPHPHKVLRTISPPTNNDYYIPVLITNSPIREIHDI